MQDVPERVRALASRIASSYGLDVFNVQFRREGSGMVLRIQLDRPWMPGDPPATADESVTVDDCARVSRDVSAALDVEDVVPTAYTLEVSSPGLDRPLRHAGDYERFVGRRAKVVMRQAVDGQMFFKGRLDGLVSNVGNGEAAVMMVTDDGKRHRVPMNVIKRANLEVEF